MLSFIGLKVKKIMKPKYLELVGLAFCLVAVCLTFSSSTSAAENGLRVVNLKTEHATNPLGIDAARPRLSWQLTSTGTG